MSELNDIAEKVISMCYGKANTERKFEINSAGLSANNDVASWRSSLVNFDSDADEASYVSWIEKFKEVSKSSDEVNDQLGSRRALTKPEDKQLIADEGGKKSEEKKLMKWESLGYHSSSVKEPVLHSDTDLVLDSGSVHFVYADCTETSKVCPSQPAIIFSCVDNFGNWGHGGMFDALAKLSKTVPDAYGRASKSEDLHLGDLHLIKVKGSVHFVYGNCTETSKVCPSQPAIIFSCVHNSGNWGHGGMFDALSKLSKTVLDAYGRASEFKDLHLGDLHLIKVKGGLEQNVNDDDPAVWVALAVVQSYNLRRKVPRSNISIPHLECCLSKASYSAAQNSASIHMRRIGYQDGLDRAEWYTVERLLRKYAAIYAISIYVYYHRRSASE